MTREHDFIFRAVEAYLRHKEIHGSTNSTIVAEMAKKAMEVDMYNLWSLTQE